MYSWDKPQDETSERLEVLEEEATKSRNDKVTRLLEESFELVERAQGIQDSDLTDEEYESEISLISKRQQEIKAELKALGYIKLEPQPMATAFGCYDDGDD